MQAYLIIDPLRHSAEIDRLQSSGQDVTEVVGEVFELQFCDSCRLTITTKELFAAQDHGVVMPPPCSGLNTSLS